MIMDLSSQLMPAQCDINTASLDGTFQAAIALSCLFDAVSYFYPSHHVRNN